MSDTASDPHTETLKHSSCQTHFYTSTKCRNHKCQHIILVTVLDSQKLPAVKQTLQNTRPARLISSWYKRQFNWVTEHQTRSPPSQNHYEANLTVCRGWKGYNQRRRNKELIKSLVHKSTFLLASMKHSEDETHTEDVEKQHKSNRNQDVKWFSSTCECFHVMRLQNTSSESATGFTARGRTRSDMSLKSVRFNSDSGQNNMFSSTIHPILFNTPNRSETDCGRRRGGARLLLRRFAYTSASLCSVHLNIPTQFFFKHVLFSSLLWVQLSQADTWTDSCPSRCKTDSHSVAFFDWNGNK